MSSIAENIAKVATRIREAAQAACRDPQSVQLLAVSKRQPAAAVREAAATQSHFGESYLQEALEKQQLLADLPLTWHFIGPIQSNKARTIAEHFAWVHSVDRLKVAERLSEGRPADMAPLNVCLQVNVSAEASKSGCTPAEAPELARQISRLPGLRLRGLMAIPAPAESFAAQRAAFALLRDLYEDLRPELHLDTLSMGMSDDLEAAIAEGSTWVRIGTALFGTRTPTPQPPH